MPEMIIYRISAFVDKSDALEINVNFKGHILRLDLNKDAGSGSNMYEGFFESRSPKLVGKYITLRGTVVVTRATIEDLTDGVYDNFLFNCQANESEESGGDSE